MSSIQLDIAFYITSIGTIAYEWISFDVMALDETMGMIASNFLTKHHLCGSNRRVMHSISSKLNGYCRS